MNQDKRNKKILSAYLEGENTVAIGKRHKLTKQRIIQIAKEMGAPSRAYEPSDGEQGWMVCKVDGCIEIARSRWGTLCNTHYFRGRRTGTTDERRRRGPSMTNHGYMVEHHKGHPAASKSGMLYEHRKVFYETFGPDGHQCFWCKDYLVWGVKGKGKLCVDHLNGEKSCNSAENLVPSCHRCNANRGLFMGWLSKHKDDPVIRKLFTDSV